MEDRGIRIVLGLTGDKDKDNETVYHVKTISVKTYPIRDQHYRR